MYRYTREMYEIHPLMSIISPHGSCATTSRGLFTLTGPRSWDNIRSRAWLVRSQLQVEA